MPALFRHRLKGARFVTHTRLFLRALCVVGGSSLKQSSCGCRMAMRVVYCHVLFVCPFGSPFYMLHKTESKFPSSFNKKNNNTCPVFSSHYLCKFTTDVDESLFYVNIHRIALLHTKPRLGLLCVCLCILCDQFDYASHYLKC